MASSLYVLANFNFCAGLPDVSTSVLQSSTNDKADEISAGTANTGMHKSPAISQLKTSTRGSSPTVSVKDETRSAVGKTNCFFAEH